MCILYVRSGCSGGLIGSAILLAVLASGAVAQQAPPASWISDQANAHQRVRPAQFETIEPPAPERAPSRRNAELLELVEFRELPLGEAMRTFSEQTGLNIVPSAKAAEKQVSLYLRNVPAMAALDALCRAYDLWYRRDNETDIIRINTSDEYQRDLSTFREEQTEVFTLLYPNPIDVASAIHNLFGDRVVMSLGAESSDEEYDDLQERFDRFDLVDERSGGFGMFGGGGSGFGGVGDIGGAGSRFGSRGLGSSGYGGSRSGSQSYLRNTSGRRIEREESTRTIPLREQFENLTTEQIHALEAAYAEGARADQLALVEELLRRRQATIYVTVIRRHNQVIVRTSDGSTMEQIRALIHRLDVPTPLVLLEVKVLSVDLGDDFNSVFDYQFSDGGTLASAFTTGNILPPLSDNPANIASDGTVGGGTGNLGLGISRRESSVASQTVSGWNNTASNEDLIFQFVNDNFRFRMQLLEGKNRVTTLATPLLLTANNEVSRIFIGRTEPFTMGFTPPQVVSSGTAQTNVVGTPITTLRDVGQLLLITPNINADRTVTLRIAQQNSRKIEEGGTIPVLDANGQANMVPVDTVARETVTATIVAKDGLTVALGGLIEEEVADSRDEVPVIGKLPVVGFFFRRQATERTRRETIILVRPYIFNTPSESAAVSEAVVRELSIHPNAYNGRNTLGSHSPWEVLQPDPPAGPCENTFRFHSVVPKRY